MGHLIRAAAGHLWRASGNGHLVNVCPPTVPCTDCNADFDPQNNAFTDTGGSGTDCDDNVNSDVTGIGYVQFRVVSGGCHWVYGEAHEGGTLNLDLYYCTVAETWWALLFWTEGVDTKITYGADDTIDCVVGTATDVTGKVACVDGVITTTPSFDLAGDNTGWFDCTGKTVTVTI